MDLFQYMDETAIPSGCGYSYDGVAFDGCSYYFLIPCVNKIMKTDRCYTCTDCFETQREYHCICYDYKERCFWAASRKCCHKIFKLDCCLREIDCLTISTGQEAGGIITGIAYHCGSDTLLVTFAGGVAEVNKESEHMTIRYKSCSLWILGICCVCPYYMIYGIQDGKQQLLLLDDENRCLYSETLPSRYTLKGILYNPCIKEEKDYRFELLVNKRGCYPYMRYAKLCPAVISFHPCQCNQSICKNCCGKPPCKPGDACADVIESIALVEAALSHIINAEGEKLQKVLAATGDVDKILCVNKEINKTIINATHLEHALYAKLSAVMDCCKCGDICKETCDGDCCDEDGIGSGGVDGGHF